MFTGNLYDSIMLQITATLVSKITRPSSWFLLKLISISNAPMDYCCVHLSATFVRHDSSDSLSWDSPATPRPRDPATPLYSYSSGTLGMTAFGGRGGACFLYSCWLHHTPQNYLVQLPVCKLKFTSIRMGSNCIIICPLTFHRPWEPS